MNPNNMMDTPEEVAEVEAELTQRLGRTVRVDRIANRILLFGEKNAFELLGETTEQALLTHDNRLEFLVERATEELAVPIDVLFLPRDAEVYTVPTTKLVEREERWQLEHVRAVGLVRTSRGFVPSVMLAPEAPTMRAAKNKFVHMIKALQSFDAPATGGYSGHTVAIIGEVRTFQDQFRGKAQVWASVVALPGRWVWDDDAGQLTRKEP